MINFNHALPRRTFLRGLGATLALPLLESRFGKGAQHADNRKCHGYQVRPDQHVDEYGGDQHPGDGLPFGAMHCATVQQLSRDLPE